MPVTRDRASSIVWPGTAITTTSAWEPSPPSFPSAVTSWPCARPQPGETTAYVPATCDNDLHRTPFWLRESSFACRVVLRVGEHRLSQGVPGAAAGDPRRTRDGRTPTSTDARHVPGRRVVGATASELSAVSSGPVGRTTRRL